MSVERETFGKNVFLSILMFLSGIFILGVFGNIAHNLTIHLNIRKEHVNVALDKKECIAAASLIGCNDPILPEGGYCSLPNITAPVTLGSLHRINIPIQEFADLVHCKIPTKRKILDNMILAYEIDSTHVHYGQVFSELKTKSQ